MGGLEPIQPWRHSGGEEGAASSAASLDFSLSTRTPQVIIPNLLRCKRGTALLEYSLLAAGVSLIAAAGVASVIAVLAILF